LSLRCAPKSSPTRTWQIADAPASLSLSDTTWGVTFRNASEKPFTAFFTSLGDWKDSADPRIAYFSGTAVYEASFCWAKPRANARVWLDLGDVRNIAAVALNGRDLGVLWKKPFRADLTEALRAGENRLEIRVANDWFNRFIGDERYPDDTGANAKGEIIAWPEWVLKGTKRPEAQRQTLVSRKQAGKDTPLHASGLLGPVTVIEALTAK
jgi:hypothetical protein